MVQLYKTYLFKDKDPVIDMLRTAMQKEGMSFKDIADISGVSKNTLANWFYGDVKRPQHATVTAVARALGYDFRLVQVASESKPVPRLVVSNGTTKKRKGK